MQCSGGNGGARVPIDIVNLQTSAALGVQSWQVSRPVRRCFGVFILRGLQINVCVRPVAWPSGGGGGGASACEGAFLACLAKHITHAADPLYSSVIIGSSHCKHMSLVPKQIVFSCSLPRSCAAANIHSARSVDWKNALWLRAIPILAASCSLGKRPQIEIISLLRREHCIPSSRCRTAGDEIL
jgi:hypothetical protein